MIQIIVERPIWGQIRPGRQVEPVHFDLDDLEVDAANAHVDEEPVAVGNEEPEAVANDANDHVYEEEVYDEHMVTTNGSGEFVANKRRLPSQRITKLKLKKRVVTRDGSGESYENPVNL
ncbi:hypothetical protein LXL04_001899 [Taraxacum kok-saghyz]